MKGEDAVVEEVNGSGVEPSPCVKELYKVLKRALVCAPSVLCSITGAAGGPGEIQQDRFETLQAVMGSSLCNTRTIAEHCNLE